MLNEVVVKQTSPIFVCIALLDIKTLSVLWNNRKPSEISLYIILNRSKRILERIVNGDYLGDSKIRNGCCCRCQNRSNICAKESSNQILLKVKAAKSSLNDDPLISFK